MTEAKWLASTDPVALQNYVLAKKVAPRRVKLLVVAAGDLIWDVMRPEARTAFEALAHVAEGTDTDDHRKRLRPCGELKEWLNWCLGIGGRTKELQAKAAALVREVFGNPFRAVDFAPAWRIDTAVLLARQMYDSREFSAMPILADALQDAGCDSDDVLTHCRDASRNHVRGCWVIDLVLGKEQYLTDGETYGLKKPFRSRSKGSQ